MTIGDTDNATEINLQGAIEGQYNLGNTNIVATIDTGNILLTADLLGSAGDATVDATIDLTAGDTGTAVINETIDPAADGTGGAEVTNTGIIELNASVQYTLTGNGLVKVGLQNATPDPLTKNPASIFRKRGFVLKLLFTYLLLAFTFHLSPFTFQLISLLAYHLIFTEAN